MSTLKVNTLEEATAGGATFYTSKAWINFNGQGTVAIRGSGNVSSLTDITTGKYGVNLSSVTTDANGAASSVWTNSATVSDFNITSARHSSTSQFLMSAYQSPNFIDVLYFSGILIR